MNRTRQQLKRFSLVVLATLGLSGCSNLELRDATKKFDEAVKSSESTIRSYYTSINEAERNSYFEEIRFNPKALISTFEMTKDNKVKTPLKAVIAPEYIEARLKVLDALVNYSHGLGLLAASDAPKEVNEQLQEIGKNVKKIESDISNLNGTPSSQIGAYTGFVTTIAGIAMENILEKKKDAAIKEYVEQGKDAANEAFNQLKLDLEQVSRKYERNGYARLNRYVSYYNRNLRTNDLTKAPPLVVNSTRLAFLTETKKAASDLVIVANGDPSKLIEKLQKAHDNLVNCALHGCASKEVSARVLRDFSDVLDQSQKVTAAIKALEKETK